MSKENLTKTLLVYRARLDTGRLSVGESRKGQCKGRNRSLSCQESRGLQEDRQVKQLDDDSLNNES